MSFVWLSEIPKPATSPRNQSATVSVMWYVIRPPNIGSITLALSETFWFGKPSDASTQMNRPPASGSNVRLPARPSDMGPRR